MMFKFFRSHIKRDHFGEILGELLTILKEDLDTVGVDANDARDTANDRARWSQLVAECSDQNGRN